MALNLRRYVIAARRDWNAMGPPIPAWFKVAMRRIDCNLRLQFMPPRAGELAGVNPAMFPSGVWVVCRRMPRTGWLHTKWILGLYDEHTGGVRPPRVQDVHKLRQAYSHWRRQRGHVLTDEFDKTCRRIMQARTAQSRAQAVMDLEDCMRRHNFTDYGRGRVRVPGYPAQPVRT